MSEADDMEQSQEEWIKYIDVASNTVHVKKRTILGVVLASPLAPPGPANQNLIIGAGFSSPVSRDQAKEVMRELGISTITH